MIGKKTVAAALLLPLSLQASTITLSVHQGKQTGPCTELVERFLSEYREIIPHSRIILDGPGLSRRMKTILNSAAMAAKSELSQKRRRRKATHYATNEWPELYATKFFCCDEGNRTGGNGPTETAKEAHAPDTPWARHFSQGRSPGGPGW